MMNTRKTYTSGELAKRYYSVRECQNGLKLIEITKPSSYSSRYVDSDESDRIVFMIVLFLAAYVVIAGLRLI